jgi:hypothetical protein
MTPMRAETIVASGKALGAPVVFEGFARAELAELEQNWRLDLAAAAGTPAGGYRIVREPWSDTAGLTRAGASLQADGLVRVAGGDGDALVNRAGVAWISPGRRIARIATDPFWTGLMEIGELIGAGLTHAMALVGRAPLHGMAAEIDGAGVLAVGQTMAGKSTLALALLHAGGRVVSDDFLLVERERGRPQIRALRRDLYVREGSFGLIPEDLRGRFSAEGAGPGRWVLRREDAPERFAAAVTPEVVWFLKGPRGASPVEAHAIDQAAALAAMIAAASPLFASGRYREERARVLPALAAIVESTHGFSVRLGAGLLRSPGTVVRELLARTLQATDP